MELQKGQKLVVFKNELDGKNGKFQILNTSISKRIDGSFVNRSMKVRFTKSRFEKELNDWKVGDGYKIEINEAFMSWDEYATNNGVRIEFYIQINDAKFVEKVSSNKSSLPQ